MSLYYESDGVKLYHGNAKLLLSDFDEFDACIFDPPYGENQGIQNDGSLHDSKQFLSFLFSKIYDVLENGSSMAAFWTFRRLPVCLKLAREKGWDYRRVLTMYLPNGSARPDMAFLPRTQPICLFNKSGQGRRFGNPDGTALHTHLTSILSRHIESKQGLAEKLGCDARLIQKWTNPSDPQWCFPGPEYVEKLHEIFDLGDEFDSVIEEWRNRNPGKNRDEEYRYHHDCYVVENSNTDVNWHPTPKPLSVIRHLVHTLADKGETIIDPVCGSGTTLVAAKKENRKAVGIETEEKYCEKAAKRIENTNRTNKFFTNG